MQNPKRIGELPTRHEARKHGASKYSAFRKALTGFPELLRCKKRIRSGFYDAGPAPSAAPQAASSLPLDKGEIQRGSGGTVAKGAS